MLSSEIDSFLDNEIMLKTLLIILLTLTKTSLAQDGIKLPAPSGPYQVSTQSIELHDESRKEENAWWGRRKFMIQAYYPSSESSKQDTYPYMPQTLVDGKLFGASFKAYAKPDGEIATNGLFPVILMQCGLGGVRQNSTILCEDLASHGYVVLSFDQPYVSCFVKFKEGGSITPKIWASMRVSTDRDYRYEWFEKAVMTAIADIHFLLKKLPSLNKELFKDHLNLDKIGMMGHSFGGNVALRAGFELPKIKAIIDIDSKLTERITLPENTFKKPVLFLRSGQYQEDVGDRLQEISNSKIRIFAVEHSAFNDMPYLVEKAPALKQLSYLEEIWGLFRETGLLIDPDTNVGAYPMEEWYEAFRTSVREFWDERFKEETSAS